MIFFLKELWHSSGHCDVLARQRRCVNHISLTIVTWVHVSICDDITEKAQAVKWIKPLDHELTRKHLLVDSEILFIVYLFI